MSEFREALKAYYAMELMICPKCRDMDIPKAKPTLEPQDDGSLICRTCSYHWKPVK